MKSKSGRSWRRRSGFARCVLAGWLAASSFSIGCAHAPVVLVPDPCVALDDDQLRELGEMIAIGVYPHVVRIVSQFELHCCLDDALGEEETPQCD